MVCIGDHTMAGMMMSHDVMIELLLMLHHQWSGAESVARNCVSFDAIMPLETSNITRTADINIVKNDSDYIGKKTMLHCEYVATYLTMHVCNHDLTM